MPLYLCKPGWSQSEPWRHGLQVYASPFRMEEDRMMTTSSSTNNSFAVATTEDSMIPAALNENNNADAAQETVPVRRNTIMEHRDQEESAAFDRSKNVVDSTSTHHPRMTFPGALPIRRVRHAELILVDEVCVQYGRYWLRLRWPGPQGGFAGYIALGRVNPSDINNPRIKNIESSSENHLSRNDDNVQQNDAGVNNGDASIPPVASGSMNITTSSVPVASTSESITHLLEKEEKTMFLKCATTGIYYPSSSAMELLYTYDDGISNADDGSVKSKGSVRSLLGPSHEDNGEPVFCRICREGLHDISYDPTNPATSNNRNNTNDSSSSPPVSRNSLLQQDASSEGGPKYNSMLLKQATMSHPSAENPMLSPCDCTGSIKFVHYLCIEQWRCRSRHPTAQNGLNCETCGGSYTLPPPPCRPTSDQADVQEQNEDNWLEAMPPHVLAALRRPHIWWVFGAAIVRRKYLRPLAPMIMSPIVALYCRARRMLKKRGVSRRRWSCSLCRRRARWKCVRCLRSYYCSRQCQNVSWHIVHKHLCYKPIRLIWSCVFYTLLTLVCIPGILSHPLLYGLGFACIPICFIIMGIIGGGLASSLKHVWKIDVRGRMLELGVVISTIRMSFICWGVIQGLFNHSHVTCSGTLFHLRHTRTSFENYEAFIVNVTKNLFLIPLHYSLKTFGGIFRRSNIFICSFNKTCCFESIQPFYSFGLNVNFLYDQEDKKCFYDVLFLYHIFMLALFILCVGVIFRKNRRHEGRNHHRENRHNRRAVFGPRRRIFVDEIVGDIARPHQD